MHMCWRAAVYKKTMADPGSFFTPETLLVAIDVWTIQGGSHFMAVGGKLKVRKIFHY